MPAHADIEPFKAYINPMYDVVDDEAACAASSPTHWSSASAFR